MRYKLKISVIHALGTFAGYAITDDSLSLQDLVELKDNLQGSALNLAVLREAPFDANSKETLLKASILDASVICFFIETFSDV